MAEKQTYSSIQALRAFAAVMVVIFHLKIVEIKNGGGSEPFLPTWIDFADAGVDLFFVISGFVMVSIAQGRYQLPAEAGRFLARRACRVLPPYWFYTTIVVILMAVVPSIVNTSSPGQSIVASYLLWPQPQMPVLTVGWTLIHECYFYLVMACAIAFLPEKRLTLALSCWALLTGLMFGRLSDPPPWYSLITSTMTWEFIGGAFVALYWRKLPRAAAWPILIAGIVCLFAAMPALSSMGLRHIGDPYRAPIFGSASVLIVLGAVALESSRNLGIPRWILAVGNSSYSLYLSHVFVISAIGRLWAMTPFNIGWPGHLAFLAAALLACLVVGWLSYLYLERPVLRWTHRRFSLRTATRQAAI